MLYVIHEHDCRGRQTPDCFTYNLEDSIAVYAEVARRFGRRFSIQHTDGTIVWSSDGRHATCKVCPIRNCGCTEENQLCS